MKYKFHTKNNILKKILKVIQYLKKRTFLTQKFNVKKIEKEWSKWLGVNIVFVNSGSSVTYCQWLC